MRITIITGVLISICTLLKSQPVGSWSDHLVYSVSFDVAVGSEEVYSSNGSSILVYNKEYDELKKISRINGLTETGISCIGWSEEHKALIITYKSANIDLVKGNSVYNIPDIYNKYIPGNKSIYRIRVNGRFAYLATGFGIVVIDLIKREISDTWKPGDGTETNEVFDIAFGNGNIFATTTQGIYSADLGQLGLSYYGNWVNIALPPVPAGQFTSALFSGGTLYAGLDAPGTDGTVLYSWDGNLSVFAYTQGRYIKSMDQFEGGFTVSAGSSALFYDDDGLLTKEISSFGSVIPDITRAISAGNHTWIADRKSGLIRVDNQNVSLFLNLPGPSSNEAVGVTSLNGRTIITGGATDSAWDNLWRPFNVSINESSQWNNLSSDVHFDPLRAIIDPSDNNHFFVSTWGTGLMEFENNQLIKTYNETNSPLQTIIPNRPYVRVCGMDFDKDGNLWITQTEVPGSIKVLMQNGSWIVIPLTIDVPTIGDLIVTHSGQKWIVLPRGRGLFIFDDNRTPSDFTDDLSKKMLITDNDNRVISMVYSIAEDQDGNIWIGTDMGPVVYYNPEKVFTENIKGYRIKIPRNDGSGLADYLLGTETINSVAVDGANRKWLATSGSGAYLVSSTGTEQILHFNENNSPLFSNNIASVSVDNKSGEVWFATSKGVISYRGNATEGRSSYSNVYAFPNPVKSDFNGNLTITGLMGETTLRITDISGNLVYKCTSDGGSATWDLKTYNGKKVSTGVYVVFCSSSDGTESATVKVLVIN